MKRNLFFATVFSFSLFIFQGCEPGSPTQTGSPSGPPPNAGTAVLNPQGPSGLVEGGTGSPSSSSTEKVDGGEDPSAHKVSSELGNEIISQTASVASCFAFSIFGVGSSSTPIVVYEENLGRTRNLVFAKRHNGAWEAHNLMSIDNAPLDADCFFRPALFSRFGTIYVAAASEGGPLKLFKKIGSAEWESLSPDFMRAGSSNIDIRRIGSSVGVLYKGMNNHPQICYFDHCVGFSRELNTILPDSEAHLILLPWEKEEVENVLRFAGSDDDMRDVLFLKFRSDRFEGSTNLNFVDHISRPAVAIGPGGDHFTVVYTAEDYAIHYCSFDHAGTSSGSCQDVGATGKSVSLDVGAGGVMAVTYATDNGILKLRLLGADGRWVPQTVASEVGMDFGNQSRVKLNVVDGHVNTHIVYTAIESGGTRTSLRYSHTP